jgi:AmmeMemoRadiSam system protein B/AmmeMemoRadiSam system protein A
MLVALGALPAYTIIIWIAIIAGVSPAEAKMNSEIRKPAVAGTFYPDQPTALAKTIAEMLAKTAKPAIDGHIIGLVSPHAGYIYSGPVAAFGYKALQGLQYRDVIVIAPCHVETFPGAAVYPGDAYAIPLGNVAIDNELSRKIASYSKNVTLSEVGHRVVGRGGEHSLEVQLPFLKTMLGDFKLVAIVMGSQDMETCKSLADAIAAACKGRDDILIVASSDLSHYHDAKAAKRLDTLIVESINNYDYDNLYEELADQKVEACGGGPIIAMMMAAQKLGATKASVVKYANSGDITGDNSAVVGYLSAVIFKGESASKVYEIKDEILASENDSIDINPASAVDFGLSESGKKTLLKLARESIAAELTGKKLTIDKSTYSGVLKEERGAFVTLTIGGQLRGCIGYIRAVKPLYETIIEMAAQAAFHDPRFEPLTAKEFEKVEVEISVLTPMLLVSDPKEVTVGRDGLYIVKGYASGLLLPQVAVDYGWDRQTFLDQTCLKAGLPPGTWKQSGTQIYRFQADIFGEK